MVYSWGVPGQEAWESSPGGYLVWGGLLQGGVPGLGGVCSEGRCLVPGGCLLRAVRILLECILVFTGVCLSTSGVVPHLLQTRLLEGTWNPTGMDIILPERTWDQTGSDILLECFLVFQYVPFVLGSIAKTRIYLNFRQFHQFPAFDRRAQFQRWRTRTRKFAVR